MGMFVQHVPRPAAVGGLVGPLGLTAVAPCVHGQFSHGMAAPWLMPQQTTIPREDV